MLSEFMQTVAGSGIRLNFWAAILGAMLVRNLFCEHPSIRSSISESCAAMFIAWSFTDATLDYLGLDPQLYIVPVAAIWVLTGEVVARALVLTSKDPKSASAIISFLTGRFRK